MSEVILYKASSSGAGEEVLAREGKGDLQKNHILRFTRSTSNARASRSGEECFDLAGQLCQRGAGERDSVDCCAS